MGAQAINPGPRRKTTAADSACPERNELRSVLNALRQIVRSLRVSSRLAEQSVGLSGAQLFVLQCLARQSPCSVKELAARTATDQSSVSVVVSRLVAGGHVRRAASTADGRAVALSLTASGRALLERAPEAAQDRLIGALDRLPASDLKELSRLLASVVELSEASVQPTGLFFEDAPSVVGAKGRSKS